MGPRLREDTEGRERGSGRDGRRGEEGDGFGGGRERDGDLHGGRLSKRGQGGDGVPAGARITEGDGVGGGRCRWGEGWEERGRGGWVWRRRGTLPTGGGKGMGSRRREDTGEGGRIGGGGMGGEGRRGMGLASAGDAADGGREGDGFPPSRGHGRGREDRRGRDGVRSHRTNLVPSRSIPG